MSAAAETYYDRRGVLAALGRDGLIQVILIANTVIMLTPIIIMVFSAFKTNTQIFQSPFALPDFTQVDNLVKIWNETNFLRYLFNSVVVTGSAMVLILTLGTMAAYAIARYEFFGAGFILLFFLAGLTLPLKLAIIPLFILMRDLGILNNQLSLILVYVAMGLPTTVFIMTGFIRTLPSELEDAARMDGASEARIMWAVMLPLVRPAMATVAVFTMIPIWNDLWFPLIIAPSESTKTVTLGAQMFLGQFQSDWNGVLAALTLSALPVLILYLIFSRQLIRGITSGAVK